MAYFQPNNYLTVLGTNGKVVGSQLTIAFKFAKTEIITAGRTIGFFGTGLSAFRYCGIENGKIQITLYGGSNGRIQSEAKYLNTDEIHSCILTLKDGKEKLYIDGVLQSEKTFTSTNFTMFSSNLLIGRFSTADYTQFKGYMCDLRFYDRAITDDEIITLASINISDVIIAKDQTLTDRTNKEVNYQIAYKVYPEDLQPTFTIIEGSLPAGLSLDSTTGLIQGIQTEEFTGDVKIRISAEGCDDVDITLSIRIIDTTGLLTTPHNLTSATSDSRYTISQSSTVDTTRYAWRVFDNSLDPETGCSHTNKATKNWWKIKFNEGQVYVNKLIFTCRNEDHGFTDKATSFDLQGSNDDSTWNTITSFSIIKSAQSVNEVQVNSTAAYQYWRIIDNSSSSHYLVIGELQFEYKLA